MSCGDRAGSPEVGSVQIGPNWLKDGFAIISGAPTDFPGSNPSIAASRGW
jgi:hypothetical protein